MEKQTEKEKNPSPPWGAEKKRVLKKKNIILTWAISSSIKSMSTSIAISSIRISCDRRRPSHGHAGRQAGKILFVSVRIMAYIHT
jgi:hypothetical protein